MVQCVSFLLVIIHVRLLEDNTHNAYTCTIECVRYSVHLYAGLRSAVGNVSGYRCVSDCRSRGREFDPGPVPGLEIS